MAVLLLPFILIYGSLFVIAGVVFGTKHHGITWESHYVLMGVISSLLILNERPGIFLRFNTYRKIVIAGLFCVVGASIYEYTIVQYCKDPHANITNYYWFAAFDNGGWKLYILGLIAQIVALSMLLYFRKEQKPKSN